jgi:photosystem II stability/assembly factor-like uncharacterized protein
MEREAAMQRKRNYSSQFRLCITFSVAALGIISCSVPLPGRAALSSASPTFFPTTKIQKTISHTPTFSPTLFPTLTAMPTLTGTPYPEDKWISLGPEGGEVRDIVINPLTPATIYAVTRTAGIFKSLDGGEAWESINAGQASFSILQLLMDPFSPSTLYILSAKGGIYKSENGGDSWKEIYPDYTSKPAKPWIILLAIDPSTPSTLYAKNDDQQILRSDNGGIRWVVVGDVTDVLGDFIIGVDICLEVIPQNPTALFLGTLEGLYRSNDGGASWMKTGLSEETDYLVADPGSTDTLYAGKDDGALFVSTDGGKEWKQLQNTDFNVQDLVIDPGNPSTLYAATGDPGFPFSANYKPDMAIRVSRDKGKHWDVIFQPGGIAINRIALDPNTPGNLYAGSNLGIFRSTDGGKQWNMQNKGLTAEEVDNMVIDPNAPCILFGGAANRLIKSEDCGAHWTTINANTPDAYLRTGYLLMDYLKPSTLYWLTGWNLYKSEDSGHNWKIIEVNHNDATTAIDMDPKDPKTLYAVEYCNCTMRFFYLYQSLDGGDSWKELPVPADAIISIALAPTTPTSIYAYTTAGILKSQDGGNNWQSIENGLPEDSLGDIFVDPNNSDTLFMLSEKRSMYTSTNGGGSWRKITANLPSDYLDLMIDPLDSSTMYVFSFRDGIYRSTDGGRNWSSFMDGIKTNRIKFIEFDPKNPLIVYAGTGGGLYTMHRSG